MTNEHNAGELPALPEPFTTIYDDVDHEEVGCFSSHQMHAYAREALAASHRERSDRDVPNGANCAQGEAVARWTEIARDGQLSDWNLEMASLRKYFAGLASQPADKPAGQAVTGRDYRADLQRQCVKWDAYWRAPDSHGVILTTAQAVELLEDVLGVEVEFAQADEALAPEPAMAAADALRWIMRFADKCKKPCGDDPESPTAIRNAHFATIGAAAAQGLGLVRGPSLAVPAAAVPDGMALVPAHYACNVAYAANTLESSHSVIDKHNAPPLRTLEKLLAAAPANRPADISQPAVAHPLPALEVSP